MRVRCGVAALCLLALATGMFAPTRARAADAAAVARTVHEVRRGDTLGALAKRYGVTVAALVAANQLSNSRAVLRLGQRLIIPARATTTGAPKAARPTVTRAGSAASARPAPRLTPRAPAGFVLAVPGFDDLPVLFQWPADGPVTSPFGRRRSGWHRGIDIKAAQGTPVQAAAAGVVVASGFEVRYGRVIKIEHEGAFVTIYAHNDENLVDVGDVVAAGEMIATVGKTGRATTHHVHFEIRRDGLNYNPIYLLPLPPKIARVEETDENPPDDD